ncbi:hypothetical protein C0991_001291 [Blastosporella zonata]|nr:hypothetical protein C0991_001291 [Blastosporella zonata]
MRVPISLPLRIIEAVFLTILHWPDFETVIAHDPTHALAHTSLGRTLSLLQATKLGSHVVSPPSSENITADGESVDFAFPRYEDDRLELAEPSDSSDCNHVGNGVPCRFYNHDGCARGAECDFSHAPDEKSVRDDLGKNICLYYLLGSCKFGDLKCIYSHSKAALPTTHGWWNDPEQIARVKSVLELAEKNAKEQRALDILLYRAQTKRERTRSHGRGKGRADASKSKERNSGRKPRPKAAVADGETAQTAEGEVKEAEDGAAAQANAPETAPADEKEQVNGNGAKSDVEPKVTFADATAANSSVGAEEHRDVNGGFTDYKLNEPAANGVDDVASAAPEGLPY